MYEVTPIKVSVNFSIETILARREWYDIFKILKENNCQLRILYPVKLFFRNKVGIKTHEQTKAKGIHYHKTCLTKNAKGGSLVELK